jgi:L-ascorbate metabolism protein UlaG (beta-lactamase superfamily)
MELNFNLIGCSTWVMDIDNKFKIGCDPSLAPKGTKYIYKGLKTSRVKDPVYNENTFEDVKVWVLTHGHFDHIDEKGLTVIKDGSQVVSHKNCSKILKKRENIDVTYLQWYEKKNIEVGEYKIEIEAIPALHGDNLLAKILMGGVNGYLITLSHGEEKKTIYVTSDAVFTEEIVAALKNKQIDILIANLGQAKSKMIGGPFTMNVKMLNKFMRALNPTLTLPIHTDDFAHFETSKSDLSKIEQKNKAKILANGESIKIR